MIDPTLPIAVTGTVDAGVSLATGLTLMLVGMAVVVAALLVLYAAIRLLDRILAERVPVASSAASAPPENTNSLSHQEATPKAPTRADKSADNSGRIPPHIVAVIAAAATAAMGRPVRVKRVIHLTEDHRSWISGGRAEIMQSHRHIAGRH